MNIVIAPDSFKECLSAEKVANNIEKGILKVIPKATIVKIPISDGGEGLLEALVKPTGGYLISVEVKDPLNRTIKTSYGILGDGTTAIIEMAKASGLELLKKSERNPLITSTFGTGQLILNALNRGCSKIIIGLGGSATNDGGTGMIKALGGKFLEKNNDEISEGGGALSKLYRIDISGIDNRLSHCKIIAACDVSNPLTGPKGASFVFGGQKGGNTKTLAQLDKNLSHYVAVILSDLRIDVDAIPGSGAAGGMGAALSAFFKASLISGIDLIIGHLHLEEYIKNADLVITGEGKIDTQTLHGKTVLGLASIAKKFKVPVIVIAGTMGNDIEKIYGFGVTSVFSIINKPMELSEAIEQADILLQNCVENIMRLIK